MACQEGTHLGLDPVDVAFRDVVLPLDLVDHSHQSVHVERGGVALHGVQRAPVERHVVVDDGLTRAGQELAGVGHESTKRLSLSQDADEPPVLARFALRILQRGDVFDGEEHLTNGPVLRTNGVGVHAQGAVARWKALRDRIQ